MSGSLFRPHIEPLERRRLFAVLPAGFADTLVAGGLERPVSVDFAPDGRIFITEQRGRVRVIKDGALLPAPFVTLDVSSAGERGVLGIELDPDFASNGYVYVFHTAKDPFIHNRISRFTASGDVAAPGSEEVIFNMDRLQGGSFIHNGGDLKFGPDGALYISAGENGASGNAQSLNTTLGKMLRINPDGSIPADNPFFDQTTGNNRAIWAMGFRNPYTFDIDPATGRLFVNDVGEAAWEEINEVVAGGNYGWPRVEGPHKASTDPKFSPPLFAYRHGGRDGNLDNTAEPIGASITGGTFYDAPADAPSRFPAEMADDYFFVDGTNQWIWRLDPQTGEQQRFAGRIGPAVDVEAAPDGSLYYVAYGQGELHKISAANTDAAPLILLQPADQRVTVKQPATFKVEAVGREPLSYQWRRDGIAIEGANGPTYGLVPTMVDQGATFDVIITNELGSTTSAAATLHVISGAPPAATIVSPAEEKRYRGGQKLKFRGVGADAEDGRLPASAYTWEVVFHHDEHTHPFAPATSGKRKGSVTIPRVGETSTNVWYRIHLTVTDSDGATATTFRDVFPQTATVTIDAPAGITVNLDGQPMTAPFSFTGVTGINRMLEAPLVQQIDGVSYAFKGWKGNRRPTFTIITPPTDRSYVAKYEPGRWGEE